MVELGTASNPTADYCLVYNYYGSSPTSCQLPSPGIVDVHSGSNLVSLEGTPYNTW
jgi:hypothetical protein